MLLCASTIFLTLFSMSFLIKLNRIVIICSCRPPVSRKLLLSRDTRVSGLTGYQADQADQAQGRGKTKVGWWFDHQPFILYNALGEPITLFGERAGDRRERLIYLLSK